MTEEWRAIPGYEGRYEVSDQGRVRSLDRVITESSGKRRRHRGRVLSQQLNVQGYSTVHLGRGIPRPVHRLVVEVFVGPRPEGHEVRHLDGDRTNPALINLAYGTRGENILDAVDHGTHVQARKTQCPQGHPYSGPNLYVSPKSGDRVCRSCSRAHHNAWKDRQRMRAAGLAS